MTTTRTSEQPKKPKHQRRLPKEVFVERKKRNMREISVERVREIFSYDRETGLIYRINARGNTKAGVVVDYLNNQGYLAISIDYKTVGAHRIAWIIFYGEVPDGEIDHIDGDRTNNRISNLRVVDQRINQQNRSKPSRNNKTGFLGVTQMHGKYRASIRVNGKQVTVGFFITAEEASEAYKNAKRTLHKGCTL